MVEDFIAKSYGVILGGLAEGGFETLEDPKAPQEQKQRVLKLLDFMSPLVFELVEEQIPTLSICFGHQLILKLLGAKLTTDMQYRETGIYQIHLTDEAKVDPFFKDMPDTFWAVSAHKTSVIDLPSDTKVPVAHLAWSQRTPVHAVRVGRAFYGLQFHPELSREEFLYRLQFYPSYIKANPDVVEKLPDVHVEAPRVLKNWLKYIVKYPDFA